MTSAAITTWERTVGRPTAPFLVDWDDWVMVEDREDRRALPVTGSSGAAFEPAREVDSRFECLAARLVSKVEHLRSFSELEVGVDEGFIEGAEIDAALRMPRRVVRRFKARLRRVEHSPVVVGPSEDEWAAIEVASAGDGG